MVNINNGVISMNRGDTFYMPLVINMGTKFAPDYYQITEADTIYLGIMAQDNRWERAIVKKVYDKFELTPRGIINYLDLQKPIYRKTTNYGHFGKINLPWEQIIKLKI